MDEAAVLRTIQDAAETYWHQLVPEMQKWINAAVANKTARITWALLVRKEDYRAPMPA